MCSNDDEPKVSLLLIYRRPTTTERSEGGGGSNNRGRAVRRGCISDGMSVDGVNYYDTLII